MLINSSLSSFLEIAILMALLGILFLLGFMMKLFLKFVRRFSIEKLSNVIYPNNYRYSRHYYYPDMALFQRDIEKFINRYEGELNLLLSHEARIILIVPLIEYYKNQPNDNQNDLTWRDSLGSIMNALTELNRDEFKYEQNSRKPRIVSAMNIMQAINLKWCSVPPFCRPGK